MLFCLPILLLMISADEYMPARFVRMWALTTIICGLYLSYWLIFLLRYFWADARVTWSMVRTREHRQEGAWGSTSGVIVKVSTQEHQGLPEQLQVEDQRGATLEIETEGAIFPVVALGSCWVLGARVLAVGRRKNNRMISTGPESLFLFREEGDPWWSLCARLLRYVLLLSVLALSICTMFALALSDFLAVI